MPEALVPFAPGFEEMEGVIIVDVCRRAGWRVDVVGLAPGTVTASRGVVVQPDLVWDEVVPLSYDLLILPGGAGGTEALIRDERVLKAIRGFYEAGKWVAALCAGPLAFQAAGILSPHSRVTCHPGVEKKLTTVPRQTARTVVDGKMVTSQGPGTAFEFALTLVRLLEGEEKATRLAREMILD